MTSSERVGPVSIIAALALAVGVTWVVSHLPDGEPSGPFSHHYAAPGTGCGDTSEDPESGVVSDNWLNDSHAVIDCQPDHVEIAPAAAGTAGAGDPGTSVFAVESLLGEDRTSSSDWNGYHGFTVAATAAVLDGGPDARAGITVRPYPILTEDLGLYFFAIDHSGHWYASHETIFGEFLTYVASGPLPAGGPARHALAVRVDVHTYAMTFLVDGTALTTVAGPRFDSYLVGVGLQCSVEPTDTRLCRDSFAAYALDPWS
jgi:hypothetical protein